MSAIHWSEQHPSEPGWYWYKGGKGAVQPARVREVTGGKMVYQLPGWRWTEAVDKSPGTWSTRIPEPEGYAK